MVVELWYGCGMNDSISLMAPAKINLHLHIGGLRPDGFHGLTSLFQMVSLHDQLSIRAGKERGECTVEGAAFGCSPEENLIVAACRLFRNVTGCEEGVRFICTKRIPEGAGLGGGSSDAAAALRLLNEWLETRLPEEKLADMGGRLGSDLPFFLRAPAALVEGRGERVEPVEPRSEWPLLIFRPDFSVSTGAAYRMLDESRGEEAYENKRPDEEKRLPPRELLQRYAEFSPREWGFYNSFTPVLMEHYLVYRRFFETCAEAGALYANISGSGSAAFALFAEETSREACCQSLEQLGKQMWKVKMLASHPMPVYN